MNIEAKLQSAMKSRLQERVKEKRYEPLNLILFT